VAVSAVVFVVEVSAVVNVFVTIAAIIAVENVQTIESQLKTFVDLFFFFVFMNLFCFLLGRK